MAGLALLANDLGVHVTGVDAEESLNTLFLRTKGISIVIGNNVRSSETPDFVVYSSAVPKDNPEFQRALTFATPVLRRGDYLAELAALYPRVVLIGGTHGKTTVTAMLSHILIEAGLEPAYLVGGGVGDRPVFAGVGQGETLIAEVDESDGTQSRIKGTHAVITNIEDDHCWSLGGVDQLMESFRKFGYASDYLLVFDSPPTRKLFRNHSQVDFFPSSEVYDSLSLSIPGFHNRLNASLAVFVATTLGLQEHKAITSVNGFIGVARRLTLRYDSDNVALIEDYAHHPTAVRESIKAVRERFSHNRLVVVFQPHRHERVFRYAVRFAHELSKADFVYVLPPFSAWLDDGGACHPSSIVEEIRCIPAFYLNKSFDESADKIVDSLGEGDVLMVMGAGDVTKLVPMLIDRIKIRNAVRRNG